ncbi:YARHG domain-containing protein [Ekhidna sp.]
MKFTNLFFLTLLIWIFYSCSSSNSNTSNGETPVTEKTETPKEFSFKGKDEFKLKEQLFFHLREEAVDVDENTFVKYENLTMDGTEFEYSAVLIERDLLERMEITMNHSNSLIKLANYTVNTANDHLGDTLKITGQLEIVDLLTSQVEGKVTDVKIAIKSNFYRSFLAPSYYGEFDRDISNSRLEQNLIVNLVEPVIYNRSNLYLKARIAELTKEDLAAMDGNELAYFRNEIFARHGHMFKTDRMKEHFYFKEWYTPYFDDATNFLNEIEKKNAQFIKSMES